MSIVKVIKKETDTSILVSKFPDDSLALGSQLVVYPGQTAFFIKGGSIYDEFKSGTYTISSENIPMLSSFVKIPFGGESPFQAEVWFINQVSILDCKWGTQTPIQIEDPKYGIIVPLRAYGQYGFHINNPRVFLERLIGNMSMFATNKLCEYFKGIILSKLTRIISDTLIQEQLSIVNINTHIEVISDNAKVRLIETFASYGVELEYFTAMAISVDETDKSFVRLKEAIDKKAQINIIGTSNYQMERSFNVLDNAASNDSGGLVGSAVGIGAGVGIGGQIGSMVASNINTSAGFTPPPLPPQNTQYYLGINGQQQGPFTTEIIIDSLQHGRIQPNTLAWKPGMSNWQRIDSFPEFVNYIYSCPPPLTPPSI